LERSTLRHLQQHLNTAALTNRTNKRGICHSVRAIKFPVNGQSTLSKNLTKVGSDQSLYQAGNRGNARGEIMAVAADGTMTGETNNPGELGNADGMPQGRLHKAA
jgi:hypothetical protein